MDYSAVHHKFYPHAAVACRTKLWTSLRFFILGFSRFHRLLDLLPFGFYCQVLNHSQYDARVLMMTISTHTVTN